MFIAYLRTFARMGLKAVPMRADTGPIGGDLSHEFIIPADRREPGLLPPRPDRNARPRRGISTTRATPKRSSRADRRSTPRPRKCTTPPFEALPEDKRVTARGIEVGHIFYFGTKYSETLGQGRRSGRQTTCLVEMGSTASASRAWSPAIIEASHDENGIVWPDSVAPFDLALVNLKPGDAATDDAPARRSTASWARPARRAVRRQRRAGRREIRRDGPDRPALAGHRRPQGPANGEVEVKAEAAAARAKRVGRSGDAALRRAAGR